MTIRNILLAGAALASATSLSATSAQAVNLVTNGSFETGDLTGWTSTYGVLNPFGTTYGSGMDGAHWAWLAGFLLRRVFRFDFLLLFFLFSGRAVVQ